MLTSGRRDCVDGDVAVLEDLILPDLFRLP